MEAPLRIDQGAWEIAPEAFSGGMGLTRLGYALGSPRSSALGSSFQVDRGIAWEQPEGLERTCRELCPEICAGRGFGRTVVLWVSPGPSATRKPAPVAHPSSSPERLFRSVFSEQPSLWTSAGSPANPPPPAPIERTINLTSKSFPSYGRASAPRSGAGRAGSGWGASRFGSAGARWRRCSSTSELL